MVTDARDGGRGVRVARWPGPCPGGEGSGLGGYHEVMRPGKKSATSAMSALYGLCVGSVSAPTAAVLDHVRARFPVHVSVT
jgi:hypothetical protein